MADVKWYTITSINFSYFKFPGGMFRTRLLPGFYFTTVKFYRNELFRLNGKKNPKTSCNRLQVSK